jgi:hypothetical protein
MPTVRTMQRLRPPKLIRSTSCGRFANLDDRASDEAL